MRPPDTPCLAAKSCRVNAASLYWPDAPVLVSKRDQEDNYHRILLALVLRMVEESMDWNHLSIHLGKRERQRIQGFCLMLWNSPHCPYVSKTLTLPSWSYLGQSTLYLHPDTFHPVSFIPKSSGYFLLEVISKLAY